MISFGKITAKQAIALYPKQATSTEPPTANLFLLTLICSICVTLAIKAVQQQNTLVAIITYLLAIIEPLNLKIERLYLNREFFCVSVIRWLQALDISFEMPAIIQGFTAPLLANFLVL